MKIVTYNVNGIRAAIRKGMLDWLSRENPDILLLQEIKAQVHQIPLFEFDSLGYHNYWFSAKKKGYSGVALLSKKLPDNVSSGLGIEKYDTEGRLIRADFGDVSVLSVYHPSGSSGEERQSFKMKWLEDFQNYITDLKNKRPQLIVSGDYNICHREIDIHDPVRNARNSGFLPEEREWLTGFINRGFIDSFRYFNKDPHNYTWWSFRGKAREKNKGWRIDYNMVSDNLKNNMLGASISPELYYSDHCPTTLEIEFS